jgi:hypothetical protein
VPRTGSIDILYITEIDPLWQDSELTAIINPEAVLFANPAGACGLRGRLRGGDGQAADRRTVLVRGLPGLDVSR